MAKVYINPVAVDRLMWERQIGSVAELNRRMGNPHEDSYVTRVMRQERPAQPRFVHLLADALGSTPDKLICLSPADTAAALADDAA